MCLCPGVPGLTVPFFQWMEPQDPSPNQDKCVVHTDGYGSKALQYGRGTGREPRAPECSCGVTGAWNVREEHLVTIESESTWSCEEASPCSEAAPSCGSRIQGGGIHELMDGGGWVPNLGQTLGILP